MQRLVTLIAIVFAFAALAGPTTAHAHRYVSTPLVVLNLVDEQNVSIPVMVTVQKGEVDLGSGIVMPCGSHHAIPLTEQPRLGPSPAAEPVACITGLAWLWENEQVLRPPKAA